VDNGIEDYDLLLEGNKSFLAECDDLYFHCEGLHAELAEVRSDDKKQITDPEAKVGSAKAHSADILSFKEHMAVTWSFDHSAIYRRLHLCLDIVDDLSLLMGSQG
jgi:hypothetical protein